MSRLHHGAIEDAQFRCTLVGHQFRWPNRWPNQRWGASDWRMPSVSLTGQTRSRLLELDHRRRVDMGRVWEGGWGRTDGERDDDAVRTFMHHPGRQSLFLSSVSLLGLMLLVAFKLVNFKLASVKGKEDGQTTGIDFEDRWAPPGGRHLLLLDNWLMDIAYRWLELNGNDNYWDKWKHD